MEKRVSSIFRSAYFWIFLILCGFYWVTHLLRLTFLPIFADEAIYIRWAQLIIDDPSRYLFFALNDGKTPLFIWSLVPILKQGLDPLWTARFLSVFGGFVQMLLIGWLAYRWKLHKSMVLLTMFLVVVLPFWFFNSRLALMDTWLCVWLTLSLIAVFELLQTAVNINLSSQGWLTSLRHWLREPRILIWTVVLGISLVLALWTKLSALLWLPTLLVWPWYQSRSLKNYKVSLLSSIFIGGTIGIGGFLLLGFSPSFFQLFTRGGDFLFSLPELVDQSIVSSLQRIIDYPIQLNQYLTPLVLLSPLLSLLFKSHRRLQLFLLLAAFVYLLPLLLFGQVVYSRYLLPAAIMLTLSCGVFFNSLFQQIQDSSVLWKKAAFAIVFSLLLANSITISSVMITAAYTDLASLPLTANDTFQYLTGWSAGFGTKEVAEAIAAEAEKERIVVATEGYFGSLPDGVLVYLHSRPMTNMFIDGIGQPVFEVPVEFKDKVAAGGGFEQAWLVVNSHRLEMKMDSQKLKASYCRPLNGPCLQVYDISQLMSK